MIYHDFNDPHAGLFNTQESLIDLNHPHKGMIRIDDIAGSLSKICRFGGHPRVHYSVAQHSVLVTAMVPDALKQAALLHDASETYLGDVVKPLKIKMGAAYEELEIKFTAAICSKFNIDPIKMVEVKKFDQIAGNLEYDFFIKKGNNKLLKVMSDLELTIRPYAWDWETAQYEFNRTYTKLFDIDLQLLRWN